MDSALFEALVDLGFLLFGVVLGWRLRGPAGWEVGRSGLRAAAYRERLLRSRAAVPLCDRGLLEAVYVAHGVFARQLGPDGMGPDSWGDDEHEAFRVLGEAIEVAERPGVGR
jgi:hypothetical protein